MAKPFAVEGGIVSFPRYERYKDSDVAWLGEVPEHWRIYPLKHIVSTPITDGPHETPNFLDEGIPFVSAEAVASGSINFKKIRGFISEADHTRYSQKYRPQIGDIYMVKSGATTGITAIVETIDDFNIWSPLAAIRCGNLATPRFILNFMRSRNFQEAVTLNWSFGTQQNIGMGVIENLVVTLPPVEEQQTISTFLDRETAKIDELIAEQQRFIELLKEKRQAVISHAVTKGLNPDAPMKDSGIEWLGEVPVHWIVGPVKYFFTILDGCRIPLSSEERSYKQGNFPYYGASGIIDSIDDYIFDEDLVLVSEDGANLINRATPIAFVARGRYWVNNHAHILKPVDKYLDYWTQRIEAVDLVPFITGSAQPKLTIEALTNLVIAVPPSENERGQIEQFVVMQNMLSNNLIAEAQRAIELLKERRTTLISAAVTGKIDVRGLVAD
ncbi:MAG: restriction endonuclease subunit S [Nitrosomonas sp.]|nr:restriction endonuclease subunit S [Nitrosomonas sp.]MCP5251705.1 restriction endonuclease subunit S [Burkholderiales bacterium]